MVETKKKRGRPKKIKIPDPIQDIIDDINNKEDQEFHQIGEEERKKINKQWDVSIDDPIDFFDANLSYEITGYKPINKNQGLDFDPSWFTEVRDVYKRTGHYCMYRPKTKAFGDFWTREYDRCRNGMTSHGYTITGDNYFFLNYYQLANLETAKAGEGRAIDFPSFYVIQYEWFHYLELCKRARKNAVLMKARGIGFSEMDASLAANTYNCRRASNTIIAANLSKYTEDTLSKTWNALSFLNDYTDGGFFKLRQVIDKSDIKRASFYKMVNGQKVEDGFKSQIKGIVADKPNKIRGDRCDVLLYEELGSWDNSTKAFIQGDALVSIQGATFGIKIGGGTGGDSSAALEGLRTMYYDPTAYNILPYKHNFTQTGESVLTAYFIPAFTLVRSALDKRGYTDPEKGKEYYNKRRAVYANSPKDLITYSAEYCFTAEEAFALEGDNKFNKTLIAEQLALIRLHKKGRQVKNIDLSYVYKNSVHSADNIIGIKYTENPNSHLRIIESPIWEMESIKDENGVVIWNPPTSPIDNLYVIGVDSIDIGAQDTSDTTKSPSDFCLTVKKRAYGLEEPMYVAIYKFRPDDIREAYKLTIKVAYWYHAKINIEATRMNLISWARDHHHLHYFMKRPSATYTNPTKRNINQYGSPATVAVIDHQTTLIADYVMDYCHNIWFEDMLDELVRYNDSNKTKFDIIASMGMTELADEELHDVSPREKKKVEENWQDIGYYTDEKGYKRYGIIPNNNTFKTIANDNWRETEYYRRSSNPRYR